MAAAVLFCLAVLCFQPLQENRSRLPTKPPVERLHRRRRGRCQLLHHRKRLTFRRQAFQHLKHMAVVIIEHGHKALPPVTGCVTAIKQAGADQNGIDLGWHRRAGITNTADKAGIREGLCQSRHPGRKGRILGEQLLVAAVEIEMPLHKAPVGRDQPLLFLVGAIPVQIGETPQGGYRYSQYQQEAAPHRNQCQVIFLRVQQPGLVDPVQTAEQAPLYP